MGTNYYAERDVCPHCHRGRDRLHIGKSSAGWTFSFQAYNGTETWDGEDIHSWKRWQELLLATPRVRIFDEYDRHVSIDALQGLVADKASTTELKHADYMNQLPPHKRHHPGSDWLDDDGHSFSIGEFS